MRRISCGLLLTSILISCSLVQEPLSDESGKIESVSPDDTEMNAAIREAQDTLPLFIEAFQSPTPTQTHFLIKARFPYGNGSAAEHIWVADLSLTDNEFEGVLGNEPIYVRNLHLRDRVIIQKDGITDWMIIDDNRLLGGFTIFVIRNRMADDERKQFDAELGYSIPDEPALP